MTRITAKSLDDRIDVRNVLIPEASYGNRITPVTYLSECTRSREELIDMLAKARTIRAEFDRAIANLEELINGPDPADDPRNLEDRMDSSYKPL